MWRHLLTYPECVPFDTQDLLDTLEEILGPPKGIISCVPEVSDRYVSLSWFLDRGVETGLLSRVERDDLQRALAPEM